MSDNSHLPTPLQFPGFRSFQPESPTASSDAAVLAAAGCLLQSSTFFSDFLHAIHRTGLVGEQKNALVLYLAGTSRLLPRPMNVFVKGNSSSGKNFLVSRVLGLYPEDSYVQITSASDKAWHYSADKFQHKIVYLQEQNKASGSVDPVRQLISEGNLVRISTVHRKGDPHPTTERFVAKGPIAAISTSTKDTLEMDDETRHVSIWMDDSSEQTKQILKGYIRQPEPLPPGGIATWQATQKLLAECTGIDILLPGWFDELADAMVDAGHDVRLRRYFPAFCQACRTVALIRGFGKKEKDKLEVDFADFSIARILLDGVISESLHHERDHPLDAAQCILDLTAKTGEAVTIQEVAEALGLPYKRAAERIQNAESAGLIQQANGPELRNVKRFIATLPQQRLPDPRGLYKKLRFPTACSFYHPLTGELVAYAPETAETGKVIVPAWNTVHVPASLEEQTSKPVLGERRTDRNVPESATLTVRLLARPHDDKNSQANTMAFAEGQNATQAADKAAHSPLVPNRRYTVRPAQRGGFGVYEVGSPIIVQWHPSKDEAWYAVETVNSADARSPWLDIPGAQIIKVGDCPFVYVPKWAPDLIGTFADLQHEPLKLEHVWMAGEDTVPGRLSVLYGVPYPYNKLAMAPLPWPAEGPIPRLRQLAETATGWTLVQAIVNEYPTGDDGMGVHSDYGNPKLVVGISYGAERDIGFCARVGADGKTGKKVDKSLPRISLAAGSLYIFDGIFNSKYKHGIIEDKSVTGARISVTFRAF
jgi:alkylated DNA repair dioxygenase AlkB